MMNPIAQFYQKHNLRPFQSTWLIYVHILGIIGLFYAIFNIQLLPKVLLVAFIFHNLYAIGITGGVHRLWAHKSYQATTPFKVFLMLLNSGANQGSIYHWARDHRLHHKFSDTDMDPHSINKGFLFSHVGWLLLKKSPQMVEQGKKIDMSDLQSDKVVMFQKKYNNLLGILMCFIIPTLAYNYYASVPLFFAFCMSYMTYAFVLNATWCVNSICHMFGSRPWNSKIQPRDNFFVSLITAGQGYHNWHHQFPSCWRASKDQWWMINITARLIQIACLLKLAKIKN